MTWTESDIKVIKGSKLPALLHEIPDCPQKLYQVGTFPKAKHFLVVVGTRKYSAYGKTVTEDLIAGLKDYDVCIVSGLAYGIDSIAHKAALKNGLKTIAVLPGGLLPERIYPRAHLGLAQEIIEAGGCLLSEQEPDATIAKYKFEPRNRIKAGMSHGTLIIEAAENSGTQITARLTLDYNREVMTVPQNIYSENAQLPIKLLKEGASLVSSSADITELLELEKRAGVESADSSQPPATLTNSDEILVYRSINNSRTRDEITQASGLSSALVGRVLSKLEIYNQARVDESGIVYINKP